MAPTLVANRYRILPRAQSKQKIVKHAIKWLADGQDPKILAPYISKSAPDAVIKAICNACLNLKHGPVELTNKQKSRFKKAGPAFDKLIDPRLSIGEKRRLIVRKQHGGIPPLLPLLAPLLIPVITSLGAEIIPKIIGKFFPQ